MTDIAEVHTYGFFSAEYQKLPILSVATRFTAVMFFINDAA